MKNELDEIKGHWNTAKKNLPGESTSIASIITEARKKKKSSLYFQYGNIAILVAVLIMISAFFYFVAPMQESISRVGIAMMTGGLALRILIEIFSVIKWQRINLGDDTLKNTSDTLSYYQFRKKIHGPVTITIVGAYTVGFYIQTPEFSKYIETFWMVMIDLSYVVGAVFLVWQIRKGIRQEMADLEELVKLKNQLAAQEK